MRILAIESATEACSAALFEDNNLIAGLHETIGRGHVERLIPMVAELPDKGRASRVVVSLGPGSFTGVRIGLAASRALGLAWQAEVVGYPTLALVASMAVEQEAEPVSICMTGGHGEWFAQDFSAEGFPETELASLSPETAARVLRHGRVAGSQASALVALRGYGQALPLLPDARCVPLLPRALLTHALSPVYGRPPDARLPASTA